MEEVVVSGVTLNKNAAKITICNVPDRPGVAARIFKGLSAQGISVDMIVQNVSHTRQTDISFTVNKAALSKAAKITRRIAREINSGDVLEDESTACISIVGVGMRSHPGVAAMMFGALARKKINIEMISTSDISISCVIKKSAAEQAVRVLHEKFGLAK